MYYNTREHTPGGPPGAYAHIAAQGVAFTTQGPVYYNTREHAPGGPPGAYAYIAAQVGPLPHKVLCIIIEESTRPDGHRAG